MSFQNGLLPCATCPWRLDQDASAIPRYSESRACGLMNTVGEEDAFRPIMACHGSTEDANAVCNGYMAREGWRNINVRILVAQGLVANPDEVAAACQDAGIELHTDYPSVLAKLKGTACQGQ